MRIIPVIDVQGGVVVRGIAGRRAEYRPLVSRLTNSTEPAAVAAAIRQRLGFEEFYLADLDAIDGGRANVALYAEISGRLMVDAGIRDAASALTVAGTGADVVVGLETLPGPGALGEILRAVPPERVVFSLDLKNGRPMGATEPWGTDEPAAIAAAAVALGARRMIVLDIARVGVGEGPGTQELLRALRRRHGGVELITGGGVRGMEDVRALVAAGADGVLVASALHDGRIGRLKDEG
jgi:phosphoribosylformimino-5-aminoimidazole carboxamide ribotide isomerase